MLIWILHVQNLFNYFIKVHNIYGKVKVFGIKICNYISYIFCLKVKCLTPKVKIHRLLLESQSKCYLHELVLNELKYAGVTVYYGWEKA